MILRRPLRAGAFSLLELLAVVALISGLVALAAPAVVSLQASLALNGGAARLSEDLSHARRDAVARSLPVEVRFYRAARPGDAAPAWSAWGTFTVKTSGTAEAFEPRGKRATLPPGLVLSEYAGDRPHSTLLTSKLGGVPREGTEVLNGESVPYRAFRFFPDGSTDLPSRAGATPALWYVTVARAPDSAKPVPSNFITLQVDRMNGSLRHFQP